MYLTAGEDIDESVLPDPTVYKSGLRFQFKSQLSQLTSHTGWTDAEIEALEDEWELMHLRCTGAMYTPKKRIAVTDSLCVL